MKFFKPSVTILLLRYNCTLSSKKFSEQDRSTGQSVIKLKPTEYDDS